MKNILTFLRASNANRLVFVPTDEGPDGMRALRILRSIPEVAPGDPERLPFAVARGDGPQETIWSLNRLLAFHGADVIGSQPIHCSHLPTLIGVAQAIGSALNQNLPKPSPLALPVITPHNPQFMQGTQVLSLRIHDGQVVTEFFDIPTHALRDDDPEPAPNDNLFPAHDD
jgi:hypothetical protein